MEVMAPIQDITDNKQRTNIDENRESRIQEQTSDDNSTLAEKAKETLYNAAEKTKEIVHQVKEKITGDENKKSELEPATVIKDVREESDFEKTRTGQLFTDDKIRQVID